jgi:signal transduction histidine kinase
VLWANGQLLRILDLPSFRNMHFMEKRLPEAFEELFETYHASPVTVGLRLRRETVRVLISDTVFQVGQDAFKLMVVQNIEDTLNRSESEAWKKLLSVMTHEIMNSIAPITSLSETLQAHLKDAMEEPDRHPVNLEDLSAGIRSISKRSEGLMKFAKTYRSLNKVTQLNRTNIRSADLFANIQVLMQPSLENRKIGMLFSSPVPDLELEIDTYLIEQVLINLILNAMDACDGTEAGKVQILAQRSESGKPTIRVQDNGSGIPEEIRETIFIPFFSTKKKGSGIGLSLCKQIMTLHGGQIQVRSREGAGTEMRLIFP